MKKLLNITLMAVAALLASSCHLDFIDEDNTLCRTSWQVESVTTYNMDGTQSGYIDKLPDTQFVTFFYTGNWAFEYDGGAAAEYGLWSTEVVPKNGNSFPVILIADLPGFFIKEGHSGEKYEFTLSHSGDTLLILHKHTDADEYQVTQFLRSSRRVSNTSILKTN